MNDETERMKKKSLLLSYYAQNGNNSTTNIDTISLATTGSSSSLNPINISTNVTTRDPYDINSTSFEPDLYLKKLIKVNILL